MPSSQPDSRPVNFQLTVPPGVSEHTLDGFVNEARAQVPGLEGTHITEDHQSGALVFHATTTAAQGEKVAELAAARFAGATSRSDDMNAGTGEEGSQAPTYD